MPPIFEGARSKEGDYGKQHANRCVDEGIGGNNEDCGGALAMDYDSLEVQRKLARVCLVGEDARREASCTSKNWNMYRVLEATVGKLAERSPF